MISAINSIQTYTISNRQNKYAKNNFISFKSSEEEMQIRGQYNKLLLKGALFTSILNALLYVAYANNLISFNVNTGGTLSTLGLFLIFGKMLKRKKERLIKELKK